MTNNARSVFVCNGATNHSDGERQTEDYYATEPLAVLELLKVEKFSNKIWECACGEGHISHILTQYGYDVKSTDIVDRGYKRQFGTEDFLSCNYKDLDCDIVTNPPYKYAKEFVEKALDVIADGHKVAMLLKITFLESEKRGHLLDTTPPEKSMLQGNDCNVLKTGILKPIKKAWEVQCAMRGLYGKKDIRVNPKLII